MLYTKNCSGLFSRSDLLKLSVESEALFVYFHHNQDHLLPLLFDLAGGEKDYLPSLCGIPGRRNEEWRGDSNHSRSKE